MEDAAQMECAFSATGALSTFSDSDNRTCRLTISTGGAASKERNCSVKDRRRPRRSPHREKGTCTCRDKVYVSDLSNRPPETARGRFLSRTPSNLAFGDAAWKRSTHARTSV